MALQSKSTDSHDASDIRPTLDLIARGAVMYADRLAPAQAEADVLHTDGRWYPATILAWCRHRGGWAVLIRWPNGTEDWRHHDPARLIPAASTVRLAGRCALALISHGYGGSLGELANLYR